MTPKTRKAIVWTSVAVILLTGGWFAYTAYKKNQPIKQDENLGGNKDVPKDKDNKDVLVSTPAPAPPADEFPLNIGSKGQNVKYLQKALNTLGANLYVDGVFGNKTYVALVQFAGTQYWSSKGLEKAGFTSILKRANAKKK